MKKNPEYSRHLGKAVIVVLDDDISIAGVLQDATDMALVLANCAMNNKEVDGILIVDRYKIRWTQVVED